MLSFHDSLSDVEVTQFINSLSNELVDTGFDNKEKYRNKISEWIDIVANCDDANLVEIARRLQTKSKIKNRKFEETQNLLYELLFQKEHRIIAVIIQNVNILCKQHDFETVQNTLDFQIKL